MLGPNGQLRPDIVMVDLKRHSAYLLEQTVSFSLSTGASSHAFKSNKYELLIEQALKMPQPFKVILLPYEVGSLGILHPSFFETLSRFTPSSASFRRLCIEISAAAMRGSYSVWRRRSFSNE